MSFEKAAIRRIAWLSDPYTGFDQPLMIQVLDVLENVLDRRGCVVEPIQVVGMKRKHPFFSSWLGDKYGDPETDPTPDFTTAFNGCYEILPTRIFKWRPVCDQTLSRYLSFYTQLTHADLLIAHDGIKWKVCETFRKSFPASLSMESKIPVLLIGSGNSLRRQIRNVLFPVIFPEKSAAGFKNLVEFAKLSGSKITLLYSDCAQLVNGSGLSMSVQFGALPFYEPTTLLEEKAKLQIVSAWLKMAEDRGVQAELKLDQNSMRFTESVLKYQEDFDCDLIAFDPIYFESYAFEHALRVANPLACPIWISNPSGQSASKERLPILAERLRSTLR